MIVKVGRHGRITLPSKLRRKMGLDVGDHIVIVEQGERLVLHPLNKSLLDLRGSVGVSEEQDFADIRRQVTDGRASRSTCGDG